MGPSKISLRGVTKAFGPKKVLQGIDLDVTPGESMVVIGGSGTGKSVLLKCILGLMQPDDGSIKIDGVETVDLGDHGRSQVMRKFGMLFQGGALFDSLRVWENVAFGPIQSDGMAPAKARDVAIAKLGNVGLGPEIGELFPSELSRRHAKARGAGARHRPRARDHLLRRTDHRPRSDHGRRHQRPDREMRQRPRRHRGVDHPRHGERAQDRPPHRHAATRAS